MLYFAIFYPPIIYTMEIGKMEDFTIDQFAGSMALILGSIGGLLMIIWKSRCECDINLCYFCRCHRKPPPDNIGGDSEEETIVPRSDISQPSRSRRNSIDSNVPEITPNIQVPNIRE